MDFSMFVQLRTATLEYARAFTAWEKGNERYMYTIKGYGNSDVPPISYEEWSALGDKCHESCVKREKIVAQLVESGISEYECRDFIYMVEHSDEYEWAYKKAYIANKLYNNSYSQNELANAEKNCILCGLTDVVLHLAREQCDCYFKMFNRGLISIEQLFNVYKFESVIPD